MKNEVKKLHEMLEKAGIPHQYENTPKFKQVTIIGKGGTKLCDAILSEYSYGREQGLLEIMGGCSREEGGAGGILGWLTAEEVFKRFKYCYEKNSGLYSKRKDQDGKSAL